jgi:signal transduction histidine kinase
MNMSVQAPPVPSLRSTMLSVWRGSRWWSLFGPAMLIVFWGAVIVEDDSASIGRLVMPALFTGQVLAGLGFARNQGWSLEPPGIPNVEGFIAAPFLVGFGLASLGFGAGAAVLSVSTESSMTGDAGLASVRAFLHLMIGVAIVMSLILSVFRLAIGTRQLFVWGQEQASLVAVAKADADRAQVLVLQAQMNPHFLFNALNTVASLLATDAARAERTAVSLEGVLRKTLSRSSEPLTTLGEELAFVGEYLDIERERFGARLAVTFDVDPATTAMRVPTMSVQPLVENAIKYAVSEHIDGGHIRIAAGAAGGRLHVSVQDDGPGFPKGFVDGAGLGNLRQRLQSLYGVYGRLAVESLGAGARVTLSIPASCAS